MFRCSNPVVSVRTTRTATFADLTRRGSRQIDVPAIGPEGDQTIAFPESCGLVCVASRSQRRPEIALVRRSRVGSTLLGIHALLDEGKGLGCYWVSPDGSRIFTEGFVQGAKPPKCTRVQIPDPWTFNLRPLHIGIRNRPAITRIVHWRSERGARLGGES